MFKIIKSKVNIKFQVKTWKAGDTNLELRLGTDFVPYNITYNGVRQILREILEKKGMSKFKPATITIVLPQDTATVELTKDGIKRTMTPAEYKYSGVIKTVGYFAVQHCDHFTIIQQVTNNAEDIVIRYEKEGLNRPFNYFKMEHSYDAQSALNKHNQLACTKLSKLDYEEYYKFVYNLSRYLKGLWVEPQIACNKWVFDNNAQLAQSEYNPMDEEKIMREAAAFDVEPYKIFYKSVYSKSENSYFVGELLSITGASSGVTKEYFKHYTPSKALEEAEECVRFMKQYPELFMNKRYKLEDGTVVKKEVSVIKYRGTYYCAYCEKQLEDTDNVCPRCGSVIDRTSVTVPRGLELIDTNMLDSMYCDGDDFTEKVVGQKRVFILKRNFKIKR